MQLKLQNVRGSFLDIIEATQFQGQGDFYWGGTFLVASDSTAICDALGMPKDKPGKAKDAVDKALRQVALNNPKWQGKTPDGRLKAEMYLDNILGDAKACCWTDGNKKEYDGYVGNWALSTKRYVSKGRPTMLDRDRSPILQADGTPYPGKEGRMYSGAYYNVVVEIWAQDNKFGKGLRCELLGVQFSKDGDAFSGGAAAPADSFDDLGEGVEADALI